MNSQVNSSPVRRQTSGGRPPLLWARNRYSHPRGEVPARLTEAHVPTYRTDLDGAVTFDLDGPTVSPRLPQFH